ncbi:hypothetical protein D9M68_942610 [compost metagenome]
MKEISRRHYVLLEMTGKKKPFLLRKGLVYSYRIECLELVGNTHKIVGAIAIEVLGREALYILCSSIETQLFKTSGTDVLIVQQVINPYVDVQEHIVAGRSDVFLQLQRGTAEQIDGVICRQLLLTQYIVPLGCTFLYKL